MLRRMRNAPAFATLGMLYVGIGERNAARTAFAAAFASSPGNTLACLGLLRLCENGDSGIDAWTTAERHLAAQAARTRTERRPPRPSFFDSRAAELAERVSAITASARRRLKSQSRAG